MMLAPWVLLPVIHAMRGDDRIRLLAARSAAAVALMGAVNAVATLTGCLAAGHLVGRAPPEPAVVAVHRVVGAVHGAGHHLVVGGAGDAGARSARRSSTSSSPRESPPGWLSLTEVLRGTDSWTPFVAPTATAGSTLGHQLGRGAGHHPGRGGRAGRPGDAHHAGPRPAHHHPVRRRHAARRRLLGRAGLPDRHRRCSCSSTPTAPRCATCTSWNRLIRLPLALGLAHLLGRIPLPGSASPTHAGCARSPIPNATGGSPSAWSS